MILKTSVHLLLLFAALLSGCTSLSNRADPATQDALFVVHGVDGAGPWYNDLVEGLRDGGVTSHIEIVEWGGPLMVLPNLQLPAVHKDAETKLAARITAWHTAHPAGHLSLIGHSAGCGVILGTLATLPNDFHVNEVLLLAPAVSKTYDLAPALAHVRGTMYTFYSDKDQALLNLGTSVAGTYDGVWGKSAGLTGFTTATTLPSDLRAHFQQIPYSPEFDRFGHNGDHFGYRKRKFAKQYLAPLVLAEPWSAGTCPRLGGSGASPDTCCRRLAGSIDGVTCAEDAWGEAPQARVPRGAGPTTCPRPDILSSFASEGPLSCVTST